MINPQEHIMHPYRLKIRAINKYTHQINHIQPNQYLQPVNKSIYEDSCDDTELYKKAEYQVDQHVQGVVVGSMWRVLIVL